MALKQRIARLERTSRLSAEADVEIVMACPCGWADKILPDDFNGQVIRIIRDKPFCPHQPSDQPK